MTPAPPFAVAVCGIEELAGHGTLGATHVLSILDPDHPVPEAFGSFGEHAKLELRFHGIVDPRPGEIVPTRAHVDAILAFGRTLGTERASLLVHGSGKILGCRDRGRAKLPLFVEGPIRAVDDQAGREDGVGRHPDVRDRPPGAARGRRGLARGRPDA